MVTGTGADVMKRIAALWWAASSRASFWNWWSIRDLRGLEMALRI
jgi:hypothetical protein